MIAGWELLDSYKSLKISFHYFGVPFKISLTFINRGDSLRASYGKVEKTKRKNTLTNIECYLVRAFAHTTDQLELL